MSAEVLVSSSKASAKIGRQFVDEALQNFVPEDVNKAIDQMIKRFTSDIRKTVHEELKFRQIRKIA